MADTLESLEIEVKHNASGAGKEIDKITSAIDSMAKALSNALPQLKEYASLLSKVGGSIRKSTGGGGKSGNPISEDLKESIKEADRFQIAIHKVADAQVRMAEAFENGNENAAWRAREQELNASAQADKYNPANALPISSQEVIKTASAVDVLKAKLASLKAAMQEAFEKGDTAKAFAIRGQIIQTEKAIDKANQASIRLKYGLQGVAKEADKARSPIQTLMKSIGRIAFYRAIRSAIKAVTQAFQEGFEAAYTFSSGIAGDGNRFAKAVDNVKSAGNAMKGQLGSAFISLYAAVAPIIIAIINLITRLADAMSQLFSAFTGKTYLKAQVNAAGLADSMAGGAKAAKEWKNQLMGFDEINKLEAPGDGGGGGGTAAANPADMFQDAEIDGIFAKMKAKLDELKNSLNFEPLKAAWDHLKEAVKGFADVVMTYLAAAWDKILVPLAHWVIEEAAPRLVELLAKAFEFLSAVLEKLRPVFEWVWEHILKPIAEFVGVAFLSFLDSVIDLLGKLTDLISGKTTFKEFLESLSPGQSILLGIATALIVVNGAISLFSGIVSAVTLVVGGLSAALTFLLSPIGLVIIAITALIAIGIALYQNWDVIKEKFRQAGEDLRGDWERTKEFFSQTADSMKQIGTNLVESLKEQFHQIGEDLRGDLERAKSMVQNAVAQIKSVFEGAKAAILNVFNGIRAGIQNIINSIISMIQRLAQSIKNLFSSIGSLGGAFNIVGMPQYASGGFPEDGLFMANHGEMVGQFSNGRTAVANNQEIVEGIKQGVIDAMLTVGGTQGGGRNTEFVFQLNGKDFARAIYNDQQAVSRERGQRLVKSYGGY